MMNILITVVIILLISLKEKEIKTTRLWLLPAILAYVVFTSIAQTTLTVNSMLLYILCLVIGCGIGACRAYLEQIIIHPESGKIMSKGSLASSILLIVVLLLRQLVSSLDVHNTFHVLSSALLILPLGSIAARRYFLYSKVRRLQERGV
ncbi:DUF1453 family protein [Paenibacillus agri]|uniref:DUF1453 family protein n=1 Tax=Paenibacillus agri TaxID=2744309 RepID=A0A850EUH3_9BACL|nr:DUF1453 family protein [Paenibacillus agri]NUU64495.1 DUF1453 family protein [Paenibacillus agri]